MIKVTISIPVYKVEDYLRPCLDSVLGQTLRDIEVICVDDASPDGCAAILDEYAAKDSRVRVIHLDVNRGQGYGRNLGIEQGRGKYIYFLDSDDEITPDAMEQLFEKAEKEDLDGIFFDSEVVFESEELSVKHASYPAARKGTYPEGAVRGTELFDAFMRQDEWTCYVQRQFWDLDFVRREGIRYPVRAEHEDEVFAFCAILAARRAAYWNRKFFIRRYRPDSVMTRPPAPKNFHGYLIDMCCMDRFLRQRGIVSESADRNISRLYGILKRYYREMKDSCDLEELFEKESDKELYRLFRIAQEAPRFAVRLGPDTLAAAASGCKLFLYGAGIVAGRVYDALELGGFAVERFLVTDASSSKKTFRGHGVCGLTEADIPSDAAVIVAVSEGYREEIEAGLRSRGIRCIYYKE